MTELQTIFNEAAEARVFPGGAVFLAKDRTVYAHEAFGTTAYGAPISRPVTVDTLYDLASVTKLWTMTAFLMAARDNEISLESPLGHFLPQFATAEQADVRLWHLLTHSHGWTLHIQSLTAVTGDEWLDHIAQSTPTTEPGSKTEYMCTPYFVLGKLIELWSGQTLDVFVEERLTRPLRLTRTLYNPLRRFSEDEIAPTEVDGQTGEPRRGVVHDEAGRALGGVSGNSGLFSVAADLGAFAQMWLDEGTFNGVQIVHPEDVRLSFSQSVAGENYHQGLGWHIDVSSWMSPSAPAGTAGHLGFTGPSFFISPQKHICIILNNRVYPTRTGPWRMGFHRRVAEWLFAQS